MIYEICLHDAQFTMEDNSATVGRDVRKDQMRLQLGNLRANRRPHRVLCTHNTHAHTIHVLAAPRHADENVKEFERVEALLERAHIIVDIESESTTTEGEKGEPSLDLDLPRFMHFCKVVDVARLASLPPFPSLPFPLFVARLSRLLISNYGNRVHTIIIDRILHAYTILPTSIIWARCPPPPG